MIISSYDPQRMATELIGQKDFGSDHELNMVPCFKGSHLPDSQLKRTSESEALWDLCQVFHRLDALINLPFQE